MTTEAEADIRRKETADWFARLNQRKVTTADVCGWSADSMEAQAFAYLAVRAKRGLPYTYPTTTGVAAPMTGGVLAEPCAALLHDFFAQRRD